MSYTTRKNLMVVVISGLSMLFFYIFKLMHLLDSIDNYVLSSLPTTNSIVIVLFSASANLVVTTIVILLIAVWSKIKYGRIVSSILILIASYVLSMMLVLLLKPLTGFLRPGEDIAHDSFIAALLNADYFAFPSGHTVRATVLSCFALSSFERKTRYIMLMYPIIIGISRMMLGVHYLSDIVGGILLGLFTYNLLEYTYPYWYKYISPILSRFKWV